MIEWKDAKKEKPAHYQDKVFFWSEINQPEEKRFTLRELLDAIEVAEKEVKRLRNMLAERILE
jgi:hypothetical protein